MGSLPAGDLSPELADPRHHEGPVAVLILCRLHRGPPQYTGNGGACLEVAEGGRSWGPRLQAGPLAGGRPCQRIQPAAFGHLRAAL